MKKKVILKYRGYKCHVLTGKYKAVCGGFVDNKFCLKCLILEKRNINNYFFFKVRDVRKKVHRERDKERRKK